MRWLRAALPVFLMTLSSIAHAAPAELDFANRLYGDLAHTPGNLFFSPASIRLCLGLAYAGARGDDRCADARDLGLRSGHGRGRPGGRAACALGQAGQARAAGRFTGCRSGDAEILGRGAPATHHAAAHRQSSVDPGRSPLPRRLPGAPQEGLSRRRDQRRLQDLRREDSRGHQPVGERPDRKENPYAHSGEHAAARTRAPCW